MFNNKKRWVFPAALLMLCAMLAACSASEEKDISCVIGVTNDGNVYTAMIDLPDADWQELTKKQREKVADQCIDTVEFSREEGDPSYELTGIEKASKKRLFTYTSEDRETTFME